MAEVIGLMSRLERNGESTEHMLAEGSGLRRSADFCGHGDVPDDYCTVNERAFQSHSARCPIRSQHLPSMEETSREESCRDIHRVRVLLYLGICERVGYLPGRVALAGGSEGCGRLNLSKKLSWRRCLW